MVVLYLILWETSIPFSSIMATPIYIPHQQYRRVPFHHILKSYTCYFLSFDNSYSNRWEWIAGLLFVRPLAHVFTYLLDCKLRGTERDLGFFSIFLIWPLPVFPASHSDLPTLASYYLLNHSHNNMWWLWHFRQGAFYLAHAQCGWECRPHCSQALFNITPPWSWRWSLKYLQVT